MKLKNKQTGEIGIINYYDGKIQVVLMGMPLCGNSVLGEYETISELCEEWEDYGEPETIYYITLDGEVNDLPYDIFAEDNEYMKEIGNYFETKEEAEKAIEKLKAWKRLKDAGIKFDLATLSDENTITIFARKTGHIHNFDEDIFLIFGGEK